MKCRLVVLSAIVVYVTAPMAAHGATIPLFVAGMPIVYQETFDRETTFPLTPEIGDLSSASLQVGFAGATVNQSGLLASDALSLMLAMPNPQAGPASIGGYLTPIAFGSSDAFALRSTFSAPAGPLTNGSVWSIVLSARDGGVPDDAAFRIAATLQIRGNGTSVPELRLNLPGAINVGVAASPAELNAYAQYIFGGVAVSPFTLTLMVDRVTGQVESTLEANGLNPLTRTGQFAAGWPTLTAAGPALAVQTGPGSTSAVRVEDFSIYSNTASAVAEPPVIFLLSISLALVVGAKWGFRWDNSETEK